MVTHRQKLGESHHRHPQSSQSFNSSTVQGCILSISIESEQLDEPINPAEEREKVGNPHRKTKKVSSIA